MQKIVIMKKLLLILLLLPVFIKAQTIPYDTLSSQFLKLKTDYADMKQRHILAGQYWLKGNYNYNAAVIILAMDGLINTFLINSINYETDPKSIKANTDFVVVSSIVSVTVSTALCLFGKHWHDRAFKTERYVRYNNP